MGNDFDPEKVQAYNDLHLESAVAVAVEVTLHTINDADLYRREAHSTQSYAQIPNVWYLSEVPDARRGKRRPAPRSN